MRAEKTEGFVYLNIIKTFLNIIKTLLNIIKTLLKQY